MRFTNFVENNAALFSVDVLAQFMDSFIDARTGFGVDFIWPALLGFPNDTIAIIDAVSCQRPIIGYFALDEVVPRSLHKVQGVELLL